MYSAYVYIYAIVQVISKPVVAHIPHSLTKIYENVKKIIIIK